MTRTEGVSTTTGPYSESGDASTATEGIGRDPGAGCRHPYPGPGTGDASTATEGASHDPETSSQRLHPGPGMGDAVTPTEGAGPEPGARGWRPHLGPGTGDSRCGRPRRCRGRRRSPSTVVRRYETMSELEMRLTYQTDWALLPGAPPLRIAGAGRGRSVGDDTLDVPSSLWAAEASPAARRCNANSMHLSLTALVATMAMECWSFWTWLRVQRFQPWSIRTARGWFRPAGVRRDAVAVLEVSHSRLYGTTSISFGRDDSGEDCNQSKRDGAWSM